MKERIELNRKEEERKGEERKEEENLLLTENRIFFQ
jgi:hypothetical protein